MTTATKLQKIGRSVVTASILLFLGCGSASNNDQGMGVTLLGFFSAPGAGTGAILPAGLVGAYIRLGDSGPSEPNGVPTGVGVGPSGDLIAYVGAQNNLTQVGINVQRLEYSYRIPGATMQPPSTSSPFALVLGPASNNATGTTAGVINQATGTQFNSSLPAAFANIPNRSFGQASVIPGSIAAWINLNRANLPEPPFKLEVTTHALYTTTAGDLQQTQDITLDVDVLPETFVEPTQAAEDEDTTDTGSQTADTSEQTDDSSDMGTDEGVDSGLSTDDSLTDTTTDDSGSSL